MLKPRQPTPLKMHSSANFHHFALQVGCCLGAVFLVLLPWGTNVLTTDTHVANRQLLLALHHLHRSTIIPVGLVFVQDKSAVIAGVSQ